MSRRHENSRMKSSFMTSRDRRNDMDHDLYMGPRHVDAGEERPLHTRRSLTPPYVVEESRRAVAGDRRSNSRERMRERDYEQNIGRLHGDRMLLRSPLVEHVPKRPHLDEAFNVSPTLMRGRREYDYSEYVDYNNMVTRSKHTHTYNDHFEIAEEKDYGERRLRARGHDSLVQKSVPIDHDMDREVWSRPNYGYPTKYGEASRYSTTVVHKFKDENTHSRSSMSHDKVSKDMYYKERNNPSHYSRENSYIEPPSSQVRDIGNEDLLKSVPSTSSGISKRGEYLTKLRDVRNVRSEAYQNCYGEVIESLLCDDYGQRSLSDTRRGYGAGVRDSKCSACDVCSSSRAEQSDYMFPKIVQRGDDNLNYVHDNSYGKRAYVHAEHDHRGLSRPDFDTTMVKVSKAEGSHYSRRVMKDNAIQELDTNRTEVPPVYMDTRRSSYLLKQSGDHMEYAHAESEKNVSNRNHISECGVLDEHEIEDPHSIYDYERYGPSGLAKTRVRRSPELITGAESQKHFGESDRTDAEDPVIFDRGLKRKFRMDEDTSRDDPRSLIPSNWNGQTGKPDFNDHWEELHCRRSRGVHTEQPSVYEQSHLYTEPEKMFGEDDRHKDSTKSAWTSYHGQPESSRQHSKQSSSFGGRHFKECAKSGISQGYSHMHHSHQRYNHYKQHNGRQRGEYESHMVERDQDADLPDGTQGPWKYKPSESEESEEFKQRVRESFLDFSKRIIDNPTACKLYKEQGKAGSLFCVVCRRSASKEFLDTRALASHAFMSHKLGLRSQHLGLHKAICVLMGWNTLPDPDSGTWVPEPLPKAEALAQKEDLILWPPVVIVHNISLSYNDHNKWKLINIDALEEFLRAKGFNLGKMRICLGNPGDHSVILVKFLNTFSGLQEAERLHSHFLDKKHGREDFEQAIFNIGKVGDSKQEGNEVEKLDDVFLYGYMGIAEDLDRVDFDTKKKSSVKSKQEIHDLADAPVKPQ